MSPIPVSFRLLSVGVLIIALGIMTDPGVRATAAIASTTFQASVDFSGVQGHRGWSYRDSTGTPLTYNTATQIWVGREPYLLLWRKGGHPGHSLGAMRRWTAPQAGSIRVSGVAKDMNVGGGDGVEIVIRRNGAVLWRQALANGNQTGVTFNIAMSVARGDALDFLVTRGSANQSHDSTQFDPGIAYVTSTATTSPGTSTGGTTASPPPPSTSTTAPPPPSLTGLHERLLGRVASLRLWTDTIEQAGAGVLASKPVQLLLTEPASTNPAYEWMGPNYYDRVAWCYRYAAASDRTDILARCRFYAREVSNAPMMANLECLARTGDYTNCSPRPANRDNHPLGLALAATDSGDTTTRSVALNGLARSAYGGFRAVSTTGFRDPREHGNGLLAVALSHAVGAQATPARWGVPWDSAAKAKTMLDTILAGQRPWGCWNTVYADPGTGIVHTPVYMQGLVLAGLQAYADYVGNDSRIVPAITRCGEWLRAKYQSTPNPSNADNRLGEGGWVYSYAPDGHTVVNGNVYPSLSGMLIGPIGWLWSRTGDARWYSLTDAAFVALVREGVAGPGTGINDSKEANQWARPIVNWISSR